MDPISLVIAALAAGAIAATKETAGTAVKDAYQGLKGLIKKKFAGETKAEMVLEEHTKDPETYEAPLKKKLAEVGIDRDEEIIKAAQELLKQENPEESKAGKYDVVFQGEVKGMQLGDRNTQTNKFS